MPPSPRQPGAETVSAWFARMSLLHRPGRWLPVLLLVGLAAYHAAWLASGTPYSRAALWTVAGCAGAGLLAVALVWSGLASTATCVRFLLAAGGLGGMVLGADLVIGRADVGSAGTTDVVGALTMIGGFLTLAAGVYLPSDVGRPSAVGAGPGHVAQEQLELAGVRMLLRRYPGFATGTNRLVDICRPLVNTTDLHFVAYHVDGECRFLLDVLDDQQLGGFFDQATPDQRRSRYLQQARYLHRLMVGFNDSFREIDSGILIRVVLDVERGALYYYWIDDRRFIIGVTLDQEMVDKADRTMVHIVDGVRASLGHKKIGDLER